MTATNEQIIAEANRRRNEKGASGFLISYVIEVMREGWTPPEPKPVDPDILAWREWGKRNLLDRDILLDCDIDAGEHDSLPEAQAYLAGARMAREQERERAVLLARCMRQEAVRLRELSTINDFDETVSDGGITAGMVCRQEIVQIAQSLNDALAKYRGEA